MARAITGADGELIDRLIAAIGADAPGADRLADTLMIMLGAELGGRTLTALYLDDGTPTVPGTAGEAQRRGRRGVDAATYLGAIRERLFELHTSGLQETFLVVAVRNYLTDLIAGFANFAALEAYRAPIRSRLANELQDTPPTDEDRVTSLRRLIDFFGPLSVDDASQRLVEHDAWTRAAELVSDDVVNDWRRAAVGRLIDEDNL